MVLGPCLLNSTDHAGAAKNRVSVRREMVLFGRVFRQLRWHLWLVVAVKRRYCWSFRAVSSRFLQIWCFGRICKELMEVIPAVTNSSGCPSYSLETVSAE